MKICNYASWKLLFICRVSHLSIFNYAHFYSISVHCNYYFYNFRFVFINTIMFKCITATTLTHSRIAMTFGQDRRPFFDHLYIYSSGLLQNIFCV